LSAIVVVDASIAVKWLIPESGSREALSLVRRWASENVEAIAPVLLWVEVTNTLFQHIRSGELSSKAATKLLLWLNEIGLKPRSEVSLIPRALTLAKEHGLTNTYDSTYLALAESEKAEFWTADVRLHTSVGKRLPWVRLVGGP
jgi:predicted nucleic acid-binding protein